jgi:hypothetical protein
MEFNDKGAVIAGAVLSVDGGNSIGANEPGELGTAAGAWR